MEHRTELSTAIKTCQYHTKAATAILKMKEPSTTGHNHHAASKSRQNSKNSIQRFGENNPLPSKTVQKDRAPNRTIKSYLKPTTTMQTQLKLS